MTKQTMTPGEVLAWIDVKISEHEGGREGSMLELLRQDAISARTAVAALIARNAELEAALLSIVGPANDPNIGWRGIGGTDVLFACEYCGAKHEDCTAIEHAAECPIPAAKALIDAARA